MKWGSFFMGILDSALLPASILLSVLIIALSTKKPLTLLAQAVLERQKAQLQKAETEHARWLEEERLLNATFDNRVEDKNAELAMSTAEAKLAARVATETAGVAVEYRRRVIAAEAGAEIREAPKTAAARKAAEIKRSLLERLIIEHDKYVAHNDSLGNNSNPLGPWLSQLPERFLK